MKSESPKFLDDGAQQGPTDRFFVKSERTLEWLGEWLDTRDFDSIYPWLEDRRGNRMIGLNKTLPEGVAKTGVVVVQQDELFAPTLAAIKDYLAARG